MIKLRKMRIMEGKRIEIIKIIKKFIGMKRNLGVRVIEMRIEKIDIGKEEIIIIRREKKIDEGIKGLIGRSNKIKEREVEKKIGRIVEKEEEIVKRMRIIGSKKFKIKKEMVIEKNGEVGEKKKMIWGKKDIMIEIDFEDKIWREIIEIGKLKELEKIKRNEDDWIVEWMKMNLGKEIIRIMIGEEKEEGNRRKLERIKKKENWSEENNKVK